MEPNLGFLLDKLRAGLESIKDSLREQTRAIHDEQETNRQAQEKIGPILSGLQIPEREKGEARAYRKNNLRIQGVIAAGTCGATLAAAIYAGLARQQVCELRKQYGEIHRQAIAAENGVAEAQAQRRLDERPWMKIQLAFDESGKEIPTTIELGKTINIPIQMIDFGRTPALKVQGTAVGEIVDMMKDPSFPPEGEHGLYKQGEPNPKGQDRQLAVQYFHTGVVNPNDRTDYSIPFLRRQGRRAIPLQVTQGQIDALRNQKSYLAVWGQIWYSDIFGIDHWTKFCVMRVILPEGNRMPNGAGERCSEYNDTDRNYEPPKPTK